MEYRFGDAVLNESHAQVSMMMEWVGEKRDVSDPWYTGDFETAYQDIDVSCKAIIQSLAK